MNAATGLLLPGTIPQCADRPRATVDACVEAPHDPGARLVFGLLGSYSVAKFCR